MKNNMKISARVLTPTAELKHTHTHTVQDLL